jgi:hemoglobin-like flavoprotein
VLQRTFATDCSQLTLFTRLVVESKSALSLLDDGAEDLGVEEICASQRFRILSVSVVTMMEMAIDLLGPDLDLVSEQLLELGGRHSRYGVTRAQFDIVGEGLIIALEDTLPAEIFKEKHKNSWKKFYAYVTDMMMEGEEQKRRALERLEKKRAAEERRKLQEEAEAKPVVPAADTTTESSGSSSTDGPILAAADAKESLRLSSSTTKVRRMILNVRLMLSGRGRGT